MLGDSAASESPLQLPFLKRHPYRDMSNQVGSDKPFHKAPRHPVQANCSLALHLDLSKGSSADASLDGSYRRGQSGLHLAAALAASTSSKCQPVASLASMLNACVTHRTNHRLPER